MSKNNLLKLLVFTSNFLPETIYGNPNTHFTRNRVQKKTHIVENQYISYSVQNLKCKWFPMLLCLMDISCFYNICLSYKGKLNVS